MIDHVSIGVRDLARSRAFYKAVLAVIGFHILESREQAIGFGKKYPEFWINHRPVEAPPSDNTGSHVCLRARKPEDVDAFYAAAVAAGGEDDGPPGLRSHRIAGYYAAFIRDPDGNRIEVVSFLSA